MNLNFRDNAFIFHVCRPMIFIKVILILLIFSCENTVNSNISNDNFYLKTNSDQIVNYVNGRKGFWSIDSKLSLDVFRFNSRNEVDTIVFKSDIDSIVFYLKEHDTIDFKIVLNKLDTASTRIISTKQISYSANPLNVKLYFEDVHNFWHSYKIAKKDSSNIKEIFKKNYFQKASPGMKDYFRIKVDGEEDAIVDHINLFPKFYNYLEKNPIDFKTYLSEINIAFTKLESLYPDSIFPDVFFVIGAFTSGGTVSDNGLLIGLNQYYKTKSTPLQEFNQSQLSLLNDAENIPFVVSHEIIHFQQNRRTYPTTVLEASIQEGMADFLCELISGKTANDKLHKWAIGKEKDIWIRFKKEMNSNKIGNWIANASKATIDNPADQGYWIGYQLCRSYYNNSANKYKAIKKMLYMNSRDYNEVLSGSTWQNDFE